MDRFHRLILYGQSEPSNGTVRKVERPDGERHFNLAYGNAPDDDLLQLLVCSRDCSVLVEVVGLTSTSRKPSTPSMAS